MVADVGTKPQILLSQVTIKVKPVCTELPPSLAVLVLFFSEQQLKSPFLLDPV